MKLTIHSDWRVVVGAETPWFSEPRHEAMLILCDQIAKDIRRHIDGFSSVTTEYTTQNICSFCKSTWEVWTEQDEAKYPECKAGMPVCCEEAQKEWQEEE
jgi:hypothetical protein